MNIKSNGHEYEFEPAFGLPEPLPKGEQILWQGSPDFRDMALRVFHIRKVAVYFAIMIASRGVYLSLSGAGMLEISKAVLLLTLLAAIAIGALTTLAWLTARTAAYTLTDQRVVMRIGIVLTLTFNLPFKRLSTAALQVTSDGFGDIPLVLNGGDRIGWLNLWPHARPWRLAHPEPMLRCIPQARIVAARLQQAWTAVNGQVSTTAAASASPVESAEPQWHATLT